MLGRQRRIRVQIHRLVDAGLFSFSLWLAHWARAASGIQIFGGSREIQPFGDYAWLLMVIFPLAPLYLAVQGFYDRPMLPSRRQTVWQLLWATVSVSLSVIIVLFLTRTQLARAVIILFGLIAFGLILFKEECLRYWLQTSIGRAQLRTRLILVGAGGETERLRADLGRDSHDDLEIVAQLNLNESPVERLTDLLHEHSANGVILAAQHIYFDQIEKAIQACELEGVEVWLLADFFRTRVSRTTVDELHGHPMLVFRSTPEASWQALAKQAIDFTGALALLVIFSPLMIAVAIAIKLTSPGPVFFRQQRSGRNGQPFTMIKFRSMVSNAEQLKSELAALNEMAGPVFKISRDPRTTWVGRIIRKSSIDEFPQLFNVLRGEMSLVGPRPLPVDEVQRFDDLAHRRRLSVKPGLTCLWQVSGRNNVTDFKEWVRLDLEYIDNWSLWLDFKILCRTVPVVLLGTGAK